MRIKLNFSDPLSISPKLDQDKLVFHIKHREDYFISKTLLINLHSNFTTLTKNLKRQMIDNDFTKFVLTSAEMAKVGVLNSFFSTLLINIIL